LTSFQLCHVTLTRRIRPLTLAFSTHTPNLSSPPTPPTRSIAAPQPPSLSHHHPSASPFSPPGPAPSLLHPPKSNHDVPPALRGHRYVSSLRLASQSSMRAPQGSGAPRKARACIQAVIQPSSRSIPAVEAVQQTHHHPDGIFPLARFIYFHLAYQRFTIYFHLGHQRFNSFKSPDLADTREPREEPPQRLRRSRAPTLSRPVSLPRPLRSPYAAPTHPLCSPNFRTFAAAAGRSSAPGAPSRRLRPPSPLPRSASRRSRS